MTLDLHKKILKPVFITVKKHPQIAFAFAVFTLAGVGMLAYYMYKNRTVRYAKKFVGEKEIAGNMGFESEKFDELMRKYGDFRDTQAWCASFVKMIWMKKMGRKYEALLDRLITPSTQTTWANFEKDDSGLFTLGTEAKKNAIVIWQKYTNGKPTWQGHTGLVKKANKDKTFTTIEGNTNDSGGREGIEVAEKERTYNFNVNNGLRLKGFIYLNPKLIKRA